MVMPCVYVFDIDGVLVDVSDRLRIASEKSKGKGKIFWSTFFSEELFKLDKPRIIGIKLLKEKAKKGDIYIISGRPKRLYDITLNQLKNLGILHFVKTIILRGNNDLRPSYIYKLEVLNRLISRGINICEVHDDDEKFVREVKISFPNIDIYLHVGNEVMPYKKIRKLNHWFRGS